MADHELRRFCSRHVRFFSRFFPGMLLRHKIVQRLWNSAVVWSWLLNLLRLGSGVLLLPLLLRHLSAADYGMYGNFLTLVALTPMLDSAFAVTIALNVSYALVGVKELQRVGIAEVQTRGTPNYALLSELFSATRKIYLALSFIVIGALAIYGTWQISSSIPETSRPDQTKIAWAIQLLAASFELYTGAWLVFLRGMNHVVITTRIMAVVYSVKLILGIVLLVLGFGLLSVPIATVFSALLQRILARHFCARLLPKEVDPFSRSPAMPVLRQLWPNTWRLALQLVSGYVAINAMLSICNRRFGLAQSGQFYLTYQILTIAMGMASAWLFVKWPMVSQLRAADDSAGLRRLLWPRVWLQLLTFLFLAAAGIVVGPKLLVLIKAETQMLPTAWALVFALAVFLEMQVSIWTTLLMAGNRIPSLWPTVFTHLVTIVLAVTLLYGMDLPNYYLPLAPLLSGLLFNFWYWPWKAPQAIGSSFWRFMFQRGAAEPRLST